MKIIKILILSILLFSINLFATDVATITALNGLATIQRDGASIKATVGAKLEQKDVIKTNDNSKLQIIFKDETIITLGKNSDFSVEEYLFEDSKEPVAKFGMLKGAMRTITGKIGKIAPQKFIVKTKTTTIGIRGTNFTVLAMKDGSYEAYCTYGAIGGTVNGKEYIVKQGFYINISPIVEIEIKEFTPEDLKEMKKKNFNFDDKKVAHATKGNSSQIVDNGENDEQLDVRVTEDSTIAIQEITDSWNSYYIDSEPVTDSSVIEGYSMTGVVYTGNYITTTNTTGNFADTGLATLTVDFAADTFELVVGTPSVQYTYNTNYTGANTNTFGTSINPGLDYGDATGTFYGPTGNIVKGTFNRYDTADPSIKVEGIYRVSTSETLH